MISFSSLNNSILNSTSSSYHHNNNNTDNNNICTAATKMEQKIFSPHLPPFQEFTQENNPAMDEDDVAFIAGIPWENIFSEDLIK